MFTWHYAVHKGGFYLVPACDAHKASDTDFESGQGITIERGLVNCEDCMRMMGMV